MTTRPASVSRSAWWIGWACASLAATLATCPPAAAQSSARRTPVVQAIQKVQPSVVNITSEKRAASPSRWPFTPEESSRERISGMGTGVIVDARGYVLTNQHVVDQVQGIEVHLHDGSVYPARLIQQDVTMDLALLKIDAKRAFVPVAIGSSADLMVGETVITLGNAFGYENTASVGIVSFIGRNVTLADDQVYRNLIQTDACINPGNSGGPLVNIDGELIGINVAVRAGAQGIGFALPIDDVKRVAAEMMSTRRLAATWHGLVTGEMFRGDRRTVVVADVPPSSPAEAAGIRRGDEVVRVGDLAVTNPLDIERGFLDVRPGQRATVVIRRAGEEKALPIEPQPLGRPAVTPTSAVASGAEADPAAEQVWQSIGLRVVEVPAEYVKSASASFRGGLYVQAVAPGSAAARAQIQKGDIVVGMNVGDRDWETVRPANILYLIRQPEAARAGGLQVYLLRRNELIQNLLSLAAGPADHARR
jgi:serine protease Do